MKQERYGILFLFLFCFGVSIVFMSCAKKENDNPKMDSDITLTGGAATKSEENSTEQIQKENVKAELTSKPTPTKEAYINEDMYQEGIQFTNEEVEKSTGTPIPEDSEKELISKIITIGEDEFEQIKSAISYETVYEYSDCFNIEKSMECYEKYQIVPVVSNNVIVNNRVELDRLYEAVLRNNALYENKSYEEFSDSVLYDYCKIICDNINEKISSYPLNLNDLDYVLSNLKIKGYSTFAYATVTEDNVLVVNLKTIEKLQNGGIEEILAHEAMHLIQKTSDNCMIGVNYRFPELKVNALYNKWFLEASAERMWLEINEKEILYTALIHYANALNLANCFSETNVEEFNFSKDLEAFYSLFCDGEVISKREIICMMKAIGYITDQDDDFLTGNNIRLNAYDRNDLVERYAGQVYETLSKKFYYDLGVMLKEGRNLQDVFSLIALFESICSMHTFYNDTFRMDNNEEFIRNYVMIQNNVFGILAEKTEIGVDEMYALYDQYNAKKSVTIACTPKDEYLNSIYARVKHKQGKSIKNVYDVYLTDVQGE